MPHLLNAELERRERFLSSGNHPQSDLALHEDTVLNLSLCQVMKENAAAGETRGLENARAKVLHSSGRLLNSSENVIANTSLLSRGSNVDPLEKEAKCPIAAAASTRYLQCIAKTPIKIIAKLLRSKYNISSVYTVLFEY